MNQVSDIVNFVIATELEQFKQDFDIASIPFSQDIRSLAIEWLCYYCRENVSDENKNAIVTFVNEIMETNDYNTVGWSRIPALLAASFVLTEDEYYIEGLLNNLACHQSSNRGFICKALSIICNMLSFYDENFKFSVETNLRKRHMMDDISVIMLLNSNGEHQAKEKWLKEICEIEPFKSNVFLTDLRSGKPYKRDFFQSTLNEVKSHILFSILKNSYSYNNQANLFSDNKRVFPKTLKLFCDNHPLDRTDFEFKLNQE
ncbi:MAG: hypothetical protein JST21_08225 [Bacteroidetes bacterium]|nr:hypothetical protein [Bacteroidota bacterium]